MAIITMLNDLAFRVYWVIDTPGEVFYFVVIISVIYVLYLLPQRNILSAKQVYAYCTKNTFVSKTERFIFHTNNVGKTSWVSSRESTFFRNLDFVDDVKIRVFEYTVISIIIYNIIYHLSGLPH